MATQTANDLAKEYFGQDYDSLGDSNDGWSKRYYIGYVQDARNNGLTPDSFALYKSQVGSARNMDEAANKYIGTQISKKQTDQQTLVDQQKASDLAAQTIEKNKALGAESSTKRATMRAELLNALQKQGETNFSLEQPGILEDLSSRGLLRSSGVGTALATEKGNIQKQIADAMAVQGAKDSGLDDWILQNAAGLNAEDFANQFALQTAGTGRNYSLDDLLASTIQANNIADTAKETQSKMSESDLLMNLISTGATAATGLPWGNIIKAINEKPTTDLKATTTASPDANPDTTGLQYWNFNNPLGATNPYKLGQ